MSRVYIVHVIANLHNAGPARSIMAYARAFVDHGFRSRHALVVLTPAAHPAMRVLATRAGFEVAINPDRAALHALVAKADVVHLHYWNSPTANAFLHEALPPCRLVIWYRVFGRYAPQTVTPFQLQRADAAWVTSVGTLDLPAFSQPPPGGSMFAPGIADFSRLEGCAPRAHEGFNVTYIGTVNPAKMHPRYLEMCRRIDVPGKRIIVCGTGGDSGLVERMNADPAFDYRGFVPQIRDVLEVSDIFGYPLCVETYATSEQSVQEAMWVGIPPVVFPHGGLPFLVRHGETGLIVDSEDEYVEAVERLFQRPEERARLGRNAREYAGEHFAIGAHAIRLSDAYADLASLPKTAREPTGCGPVARYLASLDADTATLLENLLAPGDVSAPLALDRLERVFHYPMTHGEGGIIHYRNHHPEVPEFRLWTAAALWRRNPSAARADLERAREGGIDVAGLAERLKA